jgi:predicted nucleic-acid-binding protein
MFLVDTNIFLEILLGQDKKEVCKRFLDKNIGDLSITDKRGISWNSLVKSMNSGNIPSYFRNVWTGWLMG